MSAETSSGAISLVTRRVPTQMVTNVSCPYALWQKLLIAAHPLFRVWEEIIGHEGRKFNCVTEEQAGQLSLADFRLHM